MENVKNEAAMNIELIEKQDKIDELQETLGEKTLALEEIASILRQVGLLPNEPDTEAAAELKIQNMKLTKRLKDLEKKYQKKAWQLEDLLSK